VSISLNPLLYRAIDRIDAWVQSRPRLAARLQSRVRQEDGAIAGPAHARDLRHHAVIIGYGPVGQSVTRLLKQNEIQPTVVELNLNTVKRLRALGIPAIYGDATHVDTLKSAGVATAGSLILSASGTRGSEEVIRIARELNPEIRVLARSNYILEIPELQKAGADTVFAGEGEVALALTEAILRELGATLEQIDNERVRVRDELCGNLVESVPAPVVAAVESPLNGDSADDESESATDAPAA
jgi:monovalent cation:H+ antiporter-2, CPA2 family